MAAEISRIETAAEKRAESRRVDLMSRMCSAFHALIIETNRAKTLGDADRATAFAGIRSRMAHIDLQALSLQEDSQDLAVAAAVESELG